jgi:hypothetical protein
MTAIYHPYYALKMQEQRLRRLERRARLPYRMPAALERSAN